MKAKEYVAKYCKDAEDMGEEYALNVMARALVDETKKLAESRRVSTDAGMVAVLNEMETKWHAICRLAPQFNHDGYRKFLEAIIPETYKQWIEYVTTDKLIRRAKSLGKKIVEMPWELK